MVVLLGSAAEAFVVTKSLQAAAARIRPKQYSSSNSKALISQLQASCTHVYSNAVPQDCGPFFGHWSTCCGFALCSRTKIQRKICNGDKSNTMSRCDLSSSSPACVLRQGVLANLEEPGEAMRTELIDQIAPDADQERLR
eukprot:6181822-Pleurochrysis_carterae.AAC.2